MPTSDRLAAPRSTRGPCGRPLALARVVCAVAAFVLCSFPAVATMPTLVTGFGLEGGTGPQILRITLNRKPQTLRTFLLKDPARLVLDMSPARLDGGTRHLPTSHDLIHGVRIGQFNAQTVRVVLDLKTQVTHQVEFVPASQAHDSAGIVVSVLRDDPPLSEANAGNTASSPAPPDTAPMHDAKPSPEPAPEQVAPEPPATSQTKMFVFGESTQTPPATAEIQSEPAANASSAQPGKKIFAFEETPAPPQVEERASPWGTLDLSGLLMGKLAQALHESDNSGQERMLRNTVKVEGKWTPPAPVENSDDSGAANTYLLASLQSDYLGFGPDPSSDDYDLELYEAYLHHATPDVDLRLGRQIVRWGKTDQISPVDNVNPQDLREFVIPDLEDRKIPNWMARLRLFPGDLTLEGVFIPFFRENTFDYSGNTWALLGVDDQGLRIDEDEPGHGLDNADWGMRASASMAGWDMALSYLQATEKSPHLRFDPLAPQGPTLHADYRRQHIIGWEFETTVDKFGFRGEGAYFDEQSLPTQSMNSVTRPMTHSVVGVDYLGEADWYINVQLSHQHIFDHEDDILFLRQDNFYVSGEINKEFWRGNTMLKLRYAVDLHDGGSLLTPETILTYFENLELSLGANLFFGPRSSYFGRYSDNDQAFLKAVYHF